MNNQRVNLVNSIMYDRSTEFKVLLEQSKEELVDIKIAKEQKNLVNFLAEQNKINMLIIMIRNFENRYSEMTPEKREAIFIAWINEADLRGLSPLHTAVYHSNLVE